MIFIIVPNCIDRIFNIWNSNSSVLSGAVCHKLTFNWISALISRTRFDFFLKAFAPFQDTLCLASALTKDHSHTFHILNQYELAAFVKPPLPHR